MSQIIMAFPGTGKTFFCQNNSKFKAVDYDAMIFQKVKGWEKEYVDAIEQKTKEYDIVFINSQTEVIQELNKRNIDYITLYPEPGNQTMKEILFGRYLLRDGRVNGWLQRMKDNYDERTSKSFHRNYQTKNCHWLTCTCNNVTDWINNNLSLVTDN